MNNEENEKAYSYSLLNQKGKIFTVPKALGEIKETIIITCNNNPIPAKAEIIDKATYLHQQGNTSEAAKYYQYCIDQGYNDPIVFSNYGVILLNLGKLKEAERFINKAIDLKPDYAEAHSNLGNILKELGKLKEAERSINKAIDLKPDYAEAHSNLGNILKELGKLKEAERSINEAIKLKPNYANAYYYLGVILKDLGKLKQAELSFKQALKLKIGFVQAHEALSCLLEEIGRTKEADESSKRILYLKSDDDDFISNPEKGEENNIFRKPSQLEHPLFYRPGMGTENVGSFLRSMVMMIRPKRVLEIGAGYTTPFLLEALVNNERVFDDGNLSESYFKNYIYDPKLIVIDNQSLGELTKIDGMKNIISSKYTEFIEGNFEGKSNELFKKYGYFDFVWFDCGGPHEYTNFIKEYWRYCSNFIFFHFTYFNGIPNANHQIIRNHIEGNPLMIDIVEPHKKRQGSITMLKREFKLNN